MNATERSLNVEGQRAGNSDTDPTASAPGAEVLARWKAAWSEPETSLPEKPQKPAVEDDLGEVPTPAELFAAQSDVVALLARPTLAPASGKSEEAPKPSLAAARVTESSVGGANLVEGDESAATREPTHVSLPSLTTLPVEIEEETAPVRFVEIADDEPSTPGLAILAGLQAASSTPLRMEPTVSAAPERPVMPERVQELVADTVARVLVSEPLHGGKREVRVELADSVLPQTEVRLWREEGRLRVEFITPAAVADGGLRDALPKLADAIQQRAPQSDLPVVSVAIRSSDFGAGSQDGRSRQQYQAYQEDDERA